MEIIEGRKLVAHKSVFVRFKLKKADNEYEFEFDDPDYDYKL